MSSACAAKTLQKRERLGISDVRLWTQVIAAQFHVSRSITSQTVCGQVAYRIPGAPNAEWDRCLASVSSAFQIRAGLGLGLIIFRRSGWYLQQALSWTWLGQHWSVCKSFSEECAWFAVQQGFHETELQPFPSSIDGSSLRSQQLCVRNHFHWQGDWWQARKWGHWSFALPWVRLRSLKMCKNIWWPFLPALPAPPCWLFKALFGFRGTWNKFQVQWNCDMCHVPTKRIHRQLFVPGQQQAYLLVHQQRWWICHCRSLHLRYDADLSSAQPTTLVGVYNNGS